MVVTGIFPPDIGGPATHTADLRAELRQRGDDVTVVTLTDEDTPVVTDDIVRFPRSWPSSLRHAAVALWLFAHRGEFDAVYATGMHPAAVAGAHLAGRPVVVKVVGDPAWERGRRLGLTTIDFESFRRSQGGASQLRAMRWLRDWSLRHADHLVAPSRYLADAIEDWLGGPASVEVIPNGVRVHGSITGSAKREVLRCIWIGRLVPHKRVDVLIDAIAATPNVQLDVIGDGPEMGALQRVISRLAVEERVRLLGALDHYRVLERLASCHAILLASEYEGLPHVVVEAFACGVPLVGPAVGGTGELLRDGETGLEVAEPSAERFASAIARLRDDQRLRQQLSAGARREGERWRFDRTADGIQAILDRSLQPRPRVVYLGKTRTDLPPPPDIRKKYEILLGHVDPVLVSVGSAGLHWIGRVRTVLFPNLRPAALGGALFYATAPFAAVAITAWRSKAAIVCQSPYETLGVIALTRAIPSRVRPRVVVEVHGDWRTATRLYGSRARRLLSPLADRLAEVALRSADRVRVIGGFTEGLVRGVGYQGLIDRHIAFNDLDSFLDEPPVALPSRPRALFVGVLQPYKGPDILLRAWQRTIKHVPGCQLTVIGEGPMRAELSEIARAKGLQGSVAFLGRLSRQQVRQALDDSWVLVLPSRSEGLGLVALEAMARGRAVIGSSVGGIPESVEDRITGLLVDNEDPEAFGEALATVLSDPLLCIRMGMEGRRRLEARNSAQDFEEGTRRLAEWMSS